MNILWVLKEPQCCDSFNSARVFQFKGPLKCLVMHSIYSVLMSFETGREGRKWSQCKFYQEDSIVHVMYYLIQSYPNSQYKRVVLTRLSSEFSPPSSPSFMCRVLPSILPTTSLCALPSTLKTPGRPLLLPPHHHQMAPFLTSQGVGWAPAFVFRQDMQIPYPRNANYGWGLRQRIWLFAELK